MGDSEDVVVNVAVARQQDTVQIPHQSLSKSTLRAVIEEFVTREGTEYGEHDVSLDAKVDAVLAQLERGLVAVMYDADSGSVSIAPTAKRR